MRYTWLVTSLIVLIFSATYSTAQERIYIPQLNPPMIHSFYFDGVNFHREDLDPDPNKQTLTGSVGALSLAATNRLFVLGNASTSIPVGIVDPQTRLEFPRPPITFQGGPVVISPEPDQSYAYSAAWQPGDSAYLTVIDMRPSMPGFLKPVGNPISLNIDARPNSMAINSDGSALFIGFSHGELLSSSGAKVKSVKLNASRTEIDSVQTIDLTHAPDFPGQPVVAMRLFTIGTQTYLFAVRFEVAVMTVDSNNDLSAPQVLGGGLPGFGFDVYAAEFGSEVRVAVLYFICTPDNCSTSARFDRIDVYDISTLPGVFKHRLSLDDEGSSVLGSSDDAHYMSPSLNESVPGIADYLYVAIGGSTLTTRAARIHALDTNAVLANTAGWQIETVELKDLLTADPTPPQPQPAQGVFIGRLLVRNALAPGAGTVPDAITVNGGAAATTPLVNDVDGNIEATGSALDVTHAFLGLKHLDVVSSTASNVQIVAPSTSNRIPADRHPLVLVESDGEVTRVTPDIAVVNPPTALPAHVAYAGDSATATGRVIDSANETEVVETFGTITSPGLMATSEDGKFLYISGFTGRFGVHSIVGNQSLGYDWNELLADFAAGCALQQFALDPDPSRNRAYVIDVCGQLLVIDVSNPESPNVVASQPLDCPRGIAVAPDVNGVRVYTTECFEPRILVWHVDLSDNITFQNDFATGAATVGRSDGLALSADGTKLYFSTLVDAGKKVHVYNVSGSTITDTGTSLRTANGAADYVFPLQDVRMILCPPDGRFIYVTNRSGATTDIFDASTHRFLASAPTGVSSFGFAASPKAGGTGPNEFVFVTATGPGAVSTIDARAGSPTIHQIVGVTSGGTGAGGVAVTPGLLTPSGSPVVIEPAEGVQMTFSNIPEGGEGSTSVTSSNVSDIPIPAGFVIDGLAVYYEVNTTAEFTGTVNVCFDYNDDVNQNGDPGDDEDLESDFSILHEENSIFVDRTFSLDIVNNRICAQVTGFSQFVIARKVFDRHYLHGTGPNNNPPILFLDHMQPTAGTAKYKDSTAIKRAAGNVWKLIGTWGSDVSLNQGTLTQVNDLDVWVGLKNSDDQGTNFDIRAEIYKNGTLISSGEIYCVTGITRNPDKAKQVALSLSSIPPTTLNGTSDTLSLKILTRVGTNGAGGSCGGHANATGLRLYFDSADRQSSFDATVED